MITGVYPACWSTAGAGTAPDLHAGLGVQRDDHEHVPVEACASEERLRVAGARSRPACRGAGGLSNFEGLDQPPGVRFQRLCPSTSTTSGSAARAQGAAMENNDQPQDDRTGATSDVTSRVRAKPRPGNTRPEPGPDGAETVPFTTRPKGAHGLAPAATVEMPTSLTF